MKTINKILCLIFLSALFMFVYPQEINWTFKTGSAVYSSPAYYNGSIYIGSDDSSMYCLNAATGEKNWMFKTGGIIRCRPAVKNNSVYFESDDGFLYSLDPGSGKIKWRSDIGNKIKRILPQMTSSAGIYWDYMQSSPCVNEGIVYAGSGDSCLYAVDAKSGKLIWKAKTEGIIRSSPAVYKNYVYVGSFDGFIYSFNKLKGNVVWKFNTRGKLYKHVQPSPLVRNGILYCGSRNPEFYALNAYTGKLIWDYSFGTSWVESSAIFADGTVFVGSSDLRQVLAFNPGSGKPKWTSAVSGTAWSTPCYSKGILFIGTADYSGKLEAEVGGGLSALDASTGKLKWKISSGKTEFIGGVVSSPLVREGKVYYGSLDGKVYSAKY